MHMFLIKDNILIEKRINEILGKKGFILHEFNNREIIYKVITKYDLEQLNLALEIENLRLEKSTKKENKRLFKKNPNTYVF